MWVFLLVFLPLCYSSSIRDHVPQEAPQNLILLQLEGPEALVQWDAVSLKSIRGVFKGYLLRIWNHAKTQVLAIEPNVTKTSIKFFPFSRNFITVSARNSRFLGPKSDALSFEAPQIEPNHPFLLEFYQMGQNSAWIQWSKPTEPNGILLGYNLFLSEAHKFGIDEKTTITYFVEGPDTLQKKLTSLRPGKKYQVNLSSVNCAGESDFNTMEFVLEPEEPKAPSTPFFTYKLNYSPVKFEQVCQEKPQVKIDDLDEDYYILNNTTFGKITTKPSTCLVDCLITWIPDLESNPGEHFYVKYSPKKQEPQKTMLQTNESFVILPNFNACKSYKISLVAVEGSFETESDFQETPAVIFMRKT